jgi:hypothetical protein
MWQAGATRALREPEAQPACASFEHTPAPSVGPLALAVGRWAYLKYTEITPAIGGNRADTKFGVGGPPHAIRVTGDEMPDRVSADPVRQEHHA